MGKFIDPFTVNLPTIDLHGENRDSAAFLINDFINDNIKLNHKQLVIIHGKGTNILRDFVHDYLKKDKRVDSFYLDFNIGQTIVILK